MKPSKHSCDLKSCFLCTRCLKDWLPALDIRRKTFQVKKGNTIFKEGDTVNGVYFIYHGKVKVHKQWGADKELILRIAGRGAILGHRGLGKNSPYPISATALEPASLCYVDLEFFYSTLKVNHELTYELMMFFAEELQESEKKMRNLAHMSVKGRIAQSLLMLQEKFGLTKEGFIDIPLSRQDLASLAGTTYETLFRTINELAEANIIMLSHKNIAITHMSKLAMLTHETL